MALDKQEWLALEEKAAQLRNLTTDTVFWAGSGHIGGGMSAIDCMTLLYHKYMKFKVDDPEWDDRDRFILSKGHAGVAYAPLLCDLGFMDKEELKTFNLTGSKFGIHLDANKVRGVDASTGSLGHGLSLAAGCALSARVRGKDYMTYCLTGDGELNEGSNWEAAMSIAHYHITNLVVLVDKNKCMIDGRVADVMNIDPLDEKFKAFGFEVRVVDGHDFRAMSEALDEAIANRGKGEKPFCIILDTYKGEGIDFIRDDYQWHYGALDDEKYERCLAALKEYAAKRLARVEKEA
ncbi:MAG: transketolase [Clostridiales bacterium]|nr:transketolase [Clostridiales bacterium]